MQNPGTTHPPLLMYLPILDHPKASVVNVRQLFDFPARVRNCNLPRCNYFTCMHYYFFSTTAIMRIFCINLKMFRKM